MTPPKYQKVIKNTKEPLSSHTIICDDSNTIYSYVKQMLYKKKQKKTCKYGNENADATQVNHVK